MGYNNMEIELENRYGWHPYTEVTKEQHAEVRARFLELAKFLEEMLPAGRTKSLAHTQLEDAAMWANKAVAEQAPTLPLS